MVSPYVLGQLGKAFTTAVSHEDAATRQRADRRAQQWLDVMGAMAAGTVAVGSRTPVQDLPAWVTLEVLRGGFATGRALAECPLEGDELSLCARLGLPAQRRVLFGYFLTDAGQMELYDLLDSGTYAVSIPEDAMLLVVAWLTRAGERAAALELLEAVAPFVDRFRFAPRRAPVASTPPDHVFRSTAGETRTVLAARKPKRSVETQREAHLVWNPFADRALALVLAGRVDDRFDPSAVPGWTDAARSLLDEYERLATIHTLCGKHRRSGENLAILLASLREYVSTGALTPRQNGLLQIAVAGMTAKRGTPESLTLQQVRRTQHEQALLPAHHRLAGVAADRLAALSQAEGIPDVAPFAVPVTAAEAKETAVPEGTPMPAPVHRGLRRTRSAPVESLVADGTIPSAEVLASLVPTITATVVAEQYPDPAAARLMAANYRAFRRRRSLLLLDLAKQVQLGELPWVKTMAPFATGGDSAESVAVARRVAGLALDHFGGTILPNPLIAELDQLLRAGGLAIPLVEELASDIFMGRFSDKFRKSAVAAARLLRGTVYATYYGIDADVVERLGQEEKARVAVLRAFRRGVPAETFSDLCRHRAGFVVGAPWSVAANGTVIEQAQILTTHNLAALVEAGVSPSRPWADLAADAFDTTERLLRLAAGQPRPLATVKDAAYAWRQALFFLSLAPTGAAEEFLARARTATPDLPAAARILDGLDHALKGRAANPAFLGWTTGRHWILDHLQTPGVTNQR